MDKNKEAKIKDIEKHLDKVIIFKNDADFLYLYKKTEKIATAVYLITNFFPANEPLRWSLREAVLSLLKDTLMLSNVTTSEAEKIVREINSTIFKTVSLFEVGYRAGFISLMNFSILKDEFYTLVAVLQAREKSHTQMEGITFDTTFFHVDRPQVQVPPPRPAPTFTENKPAQKQVLYKGQAKGQDVLNQIAEMHNQYVAEAKPSVSQLSSQIESPSAANAASSDKSDERQQQIIDYLKVHNVITIKDLTRVIQGCSEKTIQRDLGNLIQKGTVKKVGERRWSKYYLV